MSIISRIFSREKPVEQKRSFDAATGTSRRGKSFGTFGSINSEVAAAGQTVTARARYAAANNPWLSNAVENFATALIGTGITPATRNTELLESYRAWTDVADADRLTDFEGIQALVARSLIVDGEAIVQIIRGDNGIKLRVLPTDLLDRSLTTVRKDGVYVQQGVEFDADGNRLAYHLLTEVPDSSFATYGPPIRVPADQILHIFRPVAPGQVRGISWLAPALLAANELDQLQDALLVGAKMAAMFAGFLQNQNDIPEGDASDVLNDLLDEGIEPGLIKVLPGGTEIKFTTPQQAQQMDAFVKLNLRQLSAGIGVPVHMLDGDLTGANYSSLRAGLIPFRQKVEQIQHGVFVPQLLNPVWQMVTESSEPISWLPPKPLQVDPAKDVKATIDEINAGLTSRRKAVAERGYLLEEIDEDIKEDGFNANE